MFWNFRGFVEASKNISVVQDPLTNFGGAKIGTIVRPLLSSACSALSWGLGWDPGCALEAEDRVFVDGIMLEKWILYDLEDKDINFFSFAASLLRFHLLLDHRVGALPLNSVSQFVMCLWQEWVYIEVVRRTNFSIIQKSQIYLLSFLFFMQCCIGFSDSWEKKVWHLFREKGSIN